MSEEEEVDVSLEVEDTGSDIEESEGMASTPEERDWASEASSMGWNPEFEGENALDAKEFVLRKPLYDEMKKLRKKTRDLESAIMTQQQIHSQQIAKEKENIRKQLLAEKKQAIIDGDADKQISIEEELDKVNSLPDEQHSAYNVPPEYTEFEDKNQWYINDADMRAWADAYGLRVKEQNPNKPLSEIYAEVSKRAKDVFPHKFKNQKKVTPQMVESPTRGGGNTNKSLVDGMPRDVKVIAETMWKNGAFGDVSRKQALEEYAKSYTDQFGGW